MKQFLIKFMNRAFDDNEIYMRELVKNFRSKKKNLIALDVGCGDGIMTKKIFGKSLKRFALHGMDAFVPEDSKDMVFSKVNLETDKFKYKENTFDLVLSNQVIEHLLNKDDFLHEIYRVLKPSGLLVLSTENISSFDNILSLMFGQEPVTQHTSNYFQTSSCLSPHFMEKLGDRHGNLYGHKNVCSYFGLKRLVSLAGFKNVHIRGFGNVLRPLERVLPIYNRVITVTATK